MPAPHAPPSDAAPALVRVDRAAREVAEASLAPAAARSAVSRGRLRPEEPDAVRTAFEVDRDRILHSNAFRRLKHKTQVFLGGSRLARNDHAVTRMTHVLQVTQVARALARGLALNEPLAEAIALGHDVGHSPFGHTGEDALDAFLEGGWHHATQSLRIFEVLEDRNLTWEVRDGIRAHTWRVEPGPATEEARCVRYADRIAYLSHDALDAVRAGLLEEGDFPAAVVSALGRPGGRWIGLLVDDVLDASVAAGTVTAGAGTVELMAELRAFMFDRVYRAARTTAQQELARAVVTDLCQDLLADPVRIPASYRDAAAPLARQVVDYVAGMTDRYALELHRALHGPELTSELVAAD